jgi:hypothetical protein
MAQRRSFRRRDSPTGGPGHGYGPLVTRANSIGGVVGGIGACVGGAAALTAVVPTSALWTSRFVCDGPNKMMIDTANYSYKPGQSSTTNTFQCLVGNGVREAGFWSITALQTVLVALLLGGVLAVGWVTWRLQRRPPDRRRPRRDRHHHGSLRPTVGRRRDPPHHGRFRGRDRRQRAQQHHHLSLRRTEDYE